ncbi:MAG: DUF2807 domain-containing protein [Bacteroidales bacterium]|nr:DUF2807 domain-containing protein [Bacteroidales bacterium]
MKKFIITLAALTMTVITLGAVEPKDPAIITKDYNLKGFTGICVSGIAEIQLVKADNYSVSATFPGDLEDYLTIKVEHGDLRVSLSNIPRVIQRRLRDTYNISIKVSMPSISKLEMSGATKLYCKDSFNISEKTFRARLSGASKLDGLRVDAKELDMEMSGASVAYLDGNYEYAKIEMGGASKCTFEISASQLRQEISGAAKAYHNGDFDTIDAEVSGAGLLSIEGSADILDMEVSGAAKLESLKCPVNRINASVSGASYCEINPQEELRVSASGGSTIRYVDNGKMHLDIREISRGSSVTRLR